MRAKNSTDSPKKSWTKKSVSKVKAFYDKRIAAGKKSMQALIAVMRKLVHSNWGVWTYNQDFDGQKFYKIAA